MIYHLHLFNNYSYLCKLKNKNNIIYILSNEYKKIHLSH